MASWLTCALCGVVQEVAVDDPMPHDWKPTADEQGILCPTCVKDSGLEKVARDISMTLKQLDLEQALDHVVPPDVQTDEVECEVCNGPCQGH